MSTKMPTSIDPKAALPSGYILLEYGGYNPGDKSSYPSCVVLAFNPDKDYEPFATWVACFPNDAEFEGTQVPYVFWGHYSKTCMAATLDFEDRIKP